MMNVTGEAQVPDPERALRVLILHQHQLFASALATFFEARAWVACTTGSSKQAIMLAGRLRPDVCVVDGDAPPSPGSATLSGMDTVRAIVAVSPQTRVLLLTESYEGTVIHRALAAGARGVVHKRAEIGTVMAAAERLPGGATVVDVGAGRVAPHQATARLSDSERLASFLTTRERETLLRLARGQDTRLIADAMDVSLATARSHIQAVLMKLGVHSRIAAVSLAIRDQLIDLNESLGTRSKPTATSSEPASGAEDVASQRLPGERLTVMSKP